MSIFIPKQLSSVLRERAVEENGLFPFVNRELVPLLRQFFTVWGNLIVFFSGGQDGQAVLSESGELTWGQGTGQPAFTQTTAPFTMPAAGGTVSVAVTSTLALVAGLDVFVQGAGYMLVQSVTDLTDAVLQNISTVRTNQPAGTVVPTGSKVIPSGPAGNSMIITHSEGVLLGTDETTGVTIANNATTLSAEADILGDEISDGELNLYIKFTSTATIGLVNVSAYPSRIAGQPYPDGAGVVESIVPSNGTKKVWIGRFKASRYLTVSVANVSTGVNATNVTVGYDLFKYS